MDNLQEFENFAINSDHLSLLKNSTNCKKGLRLDKAQKKAAKLFKRNRNNKRKFIL